MALSVICDPDPEVLWWIVLLVISVTINVLVVVYLCTDCCLALIRTRRNRSLYADNKMVRVGSVVDGMTSKHRQEAAILITESLATFFILCGALYLLVEGAVASGFTASHVVHCARISFADLLFSVAIGRLAVSLVADIRRIRSSSDPEMTAQYARQTLEHVLMAVVFLLMTSSTDALLTRSLLCIMPLDHNIHNFRFLLDKCGRRKSAMFAIMSCFLSVAFRGVLPFVLLVVSLGAFRQAILDMNTKSISVVIGCAIVYTCHNAYVIVTSVTEVLTIRWQRRESSSSETSGFRANNELALNRKPRPIDLHFNQLDLYDVRGRDPVSEKQRAAIYSRIWARMNFADRWHHRSLATSPPAKVANDQGLRQKNNGRHIEKQNFNGTTCAQINQKRRTYFSKLSNFSRGFTLLDRINEEPESLESTS